MGSLLQKAVSLLIGAHATTGVSLKLPKNFRPLKKLTERELIQLESDIGGTLFGPIAADTRREFFNLDEKTWIWHEEITGEDGTIKATTTRYETQGDRVLKAQDGVQYSYLEGEELQNFLVATQLYYEQVMRGVYNRDPRTGHKLS